MRYLKLASDKNPDTDFIELNDLYGFFATSLQTLGISRKIEYLGVQNRQFAVENKVNFKRYNLTIEILTKYADYEAKYRELITFLDRNKENGFRLYYRPYDGLDIRYCLCDIENSNKIEKRQPVVLTIIQKRLWLGEEKRITTSQTEQEGNLFVFKEDEDIEDYFAVSFSEDENIQDYYCVSFYSGMQTSASLTNNSYNKIPLNMRIYGSCVNPSVLLFKKGNNEPIRKLEILASVNSGYYLEIKAGILENGVWLVNEETSNKIDYSDLVNNEFGSPYFYIDNGEYFITVIDDGNNVCVTDIYYQEEYSE